MANIKIRAGYDDGGLAEERWWPSYGLSEGNPWGYSAFRLQAKKVAVHQLDQVLRIRSNHVFYALRIRIPRFPSKKGE
jgi:hypothetical protein